MDIIVTALVVTSNGKHDDVDDAVTVVVVRD